MPAITLDQQIRELVRDEVQKQVANLHQLSPGALRAEQGYSIEELALALKAEGHCIGVSAIRRYENGSISNLEDRRVVRNMRILATKLRCSYAEYRKASEAMQLRFHR